jgi:hypothetical protein
MTTQEVPYVECNRLHGFLLIARIDGEVPSYAVTGLNDRPTLWIDRGEYSDANCGVALLVLELKGASWR